MVDDSDVEITTTYEPKEYINLNPDGTNTTSYRPPTDPALGKEAIKLANYCCSIDNTHSTFIKPNGTQYMEVHHLIPLNQQKFFKYKLDTKANIVPLCPNCHRMLHFGRIEDIKPLLCKLYEDRKEHLKSSGLDISFEELLALYK